MSNNDVMLTQEVLASARYRKSQRSDSSGSCVEVADNIHSSHEVVLLRDSKDPAGPTLTFRPVAWNSFIGGVQNREFNL